MWLGFQGDQRCYALNPLHPCGSNWPAPMNDVVNSAIVHGKISGKNGLMMCDAIPEFSYFFKRVERIGASVAAAELRVYRAVRDIASST
jgi:hypothetical protein